MNPNLPRWMFASLCVFFKSIADSVPIRFHVEGLDEDEVFDFQSDTALFRMAGPIAYQGSGMNWYQIDLQILLTDIVGLTNENAYDVYTWAGIFQSAMLDQGMEILKLGNGPEDDGSSLGCLRPHDKANIRVVSYGQVDKDNRVKQASVNGRFILDCQET